MPELMTAKESHTAPCAATTVPGRTLTSRMHARTTSRRKPGERVAIRGCFAIDAWSQPGTSAAFETAALRLLAVGGESGVAVGFMWKASAIACPSEL